MGLTRLFKGKTVFIDTAPFIYFIEKNTRYHALMKPVMTMLDARQAWGVTSTITLLEVLVHPFRDGNKRLAEKYKAILLSSNGLLTCEISHEISEQAALLRARYGLRTPDAIQLSAAICNQSDFFLTNDSALKKVSKISAVVLDDYLPPIES